MNHIHPERAGLPTFMLSHRGMFQIDVSQAAASTDQPFSQGDFSPGSP